MYNWLKFLHVMSVILWIGGMIMMLLLNRRFARLGEPALMRALGQQGAALGMAVFGPAALVALITGIGMVQVADIGFGRTWILWGIIGAILSFVVGGALTGGAARKLARQMAEGKVDAAQAAAAQKRMMMFAIANMLLLLSIVWAMVFKPV